MERRTRIALANVILVVIFAAGCTPGGSGKVVDVLRVGKPSATRSVTADGTLQATRSVPVQAEQGGKVVAVEVTDGQEVTAGQILVRLDDSGLQSQLDALESGGTGGRTGASSTAMPDLGKAFGTINDLAAKRIANLVSQITMGGDTVPSTDPTATSTKCAAAAAGDIPAIAVCKATLPLQEDILDIEQQTTQYQTQVSTGLQGDLIVASANAALASALGSASSSGATDAQTAGLRTQIDATELIATIPGRVAIDGGGSAGDAKTMALGAAAAGPATTVQTGTLVSPGQTLMTIYDMAAVQVTAEVDEADVPLVERGQAASVTVDAYPGTTLTGRVADVALNPSRSDSGGITYEVTVDIPVENLRGWRPGMTTTVDIEVEQSTPGVELPASAVVTRAGKDYVFRVEDDAARRTEVTKVQGSSGFVTITKGIDPGDKVVTSGAADLEDGDKVTIEAK